MKVAEVIPIFKQGSKMNCSNYRPISLLSSFNKIFEKIVYKRVYSYLFVNVIYEPCHWCSCFCAFSKVTLNVLDVIVVRKLSPSKLLCLPPHLIDCHLQ